MTGSPLPVRSERDLGLPPSASSLLRRHLHECDTNDGCAICERPLRGNFLVFPVCGHSVHLLCLQDHRLHNQSTTSKKAADNHRCPICSQSFFSVPTRHPKVTFASPPHYRTRSDIVQNHLESNGTPRTHRRSNIDLDEPPLNAAMSAPIYHNHISSTSDRRRLHRDNEIDAENMPDSADDAQLRQVMRFRALQKRLRSRIEVQNEALLRWKSLSETLQAQKRDLTVQLKLANEEVSRLGELDRQKSSHFQAVCRRHEEELFCETSFWRRHVAECQKRLEKEERSCEIVRQRLRNERRRTSFVLNSSRHHFARLIKEIRQLKAEVEQCNSRMSRLSSEMGYAKKRLSVLNGGFKPSTQCRMWHISPLSSDI